MKGLLFDKDGTLYDFNATWGTFTKGLLAGVSRDEAHMLQLADLIGIDVASNRFYPDSFVISETVETLARIIAPHLDDMTPEAFVAHIDTLNAEVAQVPAVDLVPLFSGLRDAGYVLGIATNDSEIPALRHLAQSGLSEMFDFVAGADSGFGAKPETGQLDAFCAATGLAPEDCAMIGDSLHDLHAGRAARMTCIGVLTGPVPRRVLEPAADVILASIADLPAWLEARVTNSPEGSS